MAKTKTSKKQKPFSLDDVPISKIKPGVRILAHDPSLFFKSKEKVRGALVECLHDGDTEAFLEILQAYLEVHNLNKLSKETGIRRATMYEIFKPDANPSFSSVMQVASAVLAS